MTSHDGRAEGIGSPLPFLLRTAAALLREAGSLPPVTVSISLPEGGVQITNPSTVPMTDRMSMVDAMARLLTDAPARLYASPDGKDYGHHAKGSFDGVPVRVTAVSTPWDRPPNATARTTTTEDIALALDAIAPWAAGLDSARVGDLSVLEASNGTQVLLIVLGDNDDDRRTAVASAVAGLPADITLQGQRAQALLTTGHRLKVIAH